MPKTLSFRQGLSSVLFWSIISAAFIGPGTVTTAAQAGASFQLQLLWALLFSILATIILQEAAARLTLASGKSLGEIVAQQYRAGSGQGIRWGLFLAVAFGCAAYQAGNLLGAVAGLRLVSGISADILLLLVGIAAIAMLWQGSIKRITRLLAAVVAIMGVAFISIAILQDEYGFVDITLSILPPEIPEGGLLLVIGLIGTTIVPYNLFLASGISRMQSMAEMRWGIAIAVLIGGIISIAILLTGTQVAGVFRFESLAAAMGMQLGEWAAAFFAFGLFAAGLSSSITAPLAAAITARALLGQGGIQKWSGHSFNFRLVWGIVMAAGLIFGWVNVKPIPAIIAAQAINGILLPVVAVFLLLAVNDRSLIPSEYRNGLASNLASLAIVGIACFLGLNNIWNATGKIIPEVLEVPYLAIDGGVSILIVGFLAFRIFTR